MSNTGQAISRSYTHNIYNSVPDIFRPCWLRVQNTPTASLQGHKNPPPSVLYVTLNNLMEKLQ